LLSSTYIAFAASRARLAAALGGAGGTVAGSCSNTTTGNAVCSCATRAVGAGRAYITQLASIPWLTHTLVNRGSTLLPRVEASTAVWIIAWQARGQCSPLLHFWGCSCCFNAFTNINSRARPECAQRTQCTGTAAQAISCCANTELHTGRLRWAGLVGTTALACGVIATSTVRASRTRLAAKTAKPAGSKYPPALRIQQVRQQVASHFAVYVYSWCLLAQAPALIRQGHC
jgi:hypothetical protein